MGESSTTGRRRHRRHWWQFRRRRHDPVTRAQDDFARQGDGKVNPEQLPHPPLSGPGAIGTGP